MKKTFTFRTIALIVATCMILTFALAAAALAPDEDLLVNDEGCLMDQVEPDDIKEPDDSDEPDNGEIIGEPGDDDITVEPGDVDDEEPGEESSSVNDDEQSIIDDTSADVEDEDVEIDGNAYGFYDPSEEFIEFTQAMEAFGDIVTSSTEPWNSSTPPTISGTVTINVSPNASGTLIIPAGNFDVTLNFTEVGTFAGNIQIGLNARVIFNVISESIVATGDITMSGATTRGIIKNGGGSLTLAGDVTVISNATSMIVNEGNLLITGNGNVTLKRPDGSEGLSLRTGEDSGDVTINSNGSVDLNGIEFNGGNFNIINGTVTIEGTIFAWNPADVTIEGGEVVISFNLSTGGNVTINGGTFTIMGSITTFDKNVTINGGRVTVHDNINTQDGNIIINYGEVIIDRYINSATGGNITINDGTITIDGYIHSSEGNIIINGGRVELTVTDECYVPDNALIRAKHIDINGGSGIINNNKAGGYAVIATSTATLSVGSGVTVWIHDTTTLADWTETHFINADDEPLSAIEFNSFTVTVTGGTLPGGGTTGSFGANLPVRITAGQPPAGQEFSRWEIEPSITPTGDTSLSTRRIEFLMPPFENITVKAIFEPILEPEPEEHALIVTHTGNGVASAFINDEEVNKAIADTEIILDATPGDGYQFVRWEVLSGGITLTNPTDQHVTFLMPDNEVRVRAVFEPVLPGQHSIIVTRTGNGVANPSVNAAAQGTTITLTATPGEGSRFVRWEVRSGGITLSSTTTATATFVMPDTAVTVHAVFELIATTTPTSPQMGDVGTGVMLAFIILGTGGATFAGVKSVISKRKK